MFQNMFAKFEADRLATKSPKASQSPKAAKSPKTPKSPTYSPKAKALSPPSPPPSPSVDDSSASTSVEPESPATIPRRKPQFVSTKGKDPFSPSPSPPRHVRTRVFLRENSDTSCGSGNERPKKQAAVGEGPSESSPMAAVDTCCICGEEAQVGNAWVCDGCEADVCLQCANNKKNDLPMAGWNPENPPEDPAYCPECWEALEAKARRSTLRKNRKAPPKMKAHQLVDFKNVKKFYARGMPKTFVYNGETWKNEPELGKEFSAGQLNCFFEPVASLNCHVLDTFRPREEPDWREWNVTAYMDRMRATCLLNPVVPDAVVADAVVADAEVADASESVVGSPSDGGSPMGVEDYLDLDEALEEVDGYQSDAGRYMEADDDDEDDEDDEN